MNVERARAEEIDGPAATVFEEIILRRVLQASVPLEVCYRYRTWDPTN